MDIHVVSGVGEGRTQLSSFDAALKDAGVYNYNLIYLSSIIPPGSKIVRIKKYKNLPEEYGYRLYAVHAEIRSRQIGKYIAAGLGWYQLDDGSGIFVEQMIEGDTKIAVKSEIELRISGTIRDMCKFRNIKFDEKKMKSLIRTTQVTGGPTCALVFAVYQSEPWEKEK